MAGLEHRRDLLFGLGQGHGQRALPVGREAVAFVGGGFLVLPEQCMGRQDGAQGADDLGLPLGALQGVGLVWGGGCIHGQVILGIIRRSFTKQSSKESVHARI